MGDSIIRMLHSTRAGQTSWFFNHLYPHSLTRKALYKKKPIRSSEPLCNLRRPQKGDNRILKRNGVFWANALRNYRGDSQASSFVHFLPLFLDLCQRLRRMPSGSPGFIEPHRSRFLWRDQVCFSRSRSNPGWSSNGESMNEVAGLIEHQYRESCAGPRLNHKIEVSRILHHHLWARGETLIGRK
jgi:hypothetical protein